MRQECIKIYQFSELSDDAKEKAREWYGTIALDYEWWDSIYDDAKNVGLKITEFDLDRHRHANGEFTLSANEVAANIMNDHGEDCETYKTAESFMEKWQPVFDEYMDETSEHYESSDHENQLMELEEEFLKSLLEDYSIMLQHEYEYLLSDKAVDEGIEANEYEFTEDGQRYVSKKGEKNELRHN